ncbi:hypothetical protein Pyn_13529 [Prunus yedoensis var. nudiflora]|uniref:Uncharacterized protein n=1 Tax=Prunus yedoensis var. nudiflora TaxID=2094558 RepID=A0A314YSG6_PRUYE|nr:hypothetical protein Pyn_27125 [Prunus yedoensis var. nudiflora]PQQ09683.1 hypothetical protein Pyn_13529 [Prunus yedoensis var. nudiflora]
MANPHNGGNPPNGNEREGEALTRVEFIEYQNQTQQTLCDIQAAFVRLVMDPNNNGRGPMPQRVHDRRQDLSDESSGDERI